MSLILILLATTSQISSFADEKSEERFACKVDSDCVLVEGPCNSPFSVNRAFEKDYRKKDEVGTITVPIMCFSFVQGSWPAGAVAVCRLNRCEVIIPKAEPKAANTLSTPRPER